MWRRGCLAEQLGDPGIEPRDDGILPDVGATQAELNEASTRKLYERLSMIETTSSR
jgi:hypothetical protein